MRYLTSKQKVDKAADLLYAVNTKSDRLSGKARYKKKNRLLRRIKNERIL